MAKRHALYVYRHWLITLWLTAFAFYHLAWSAHETAFATQNAFDLAEQVSIHPAIRAESPVLRTSGFLRLPIPLIAFGLTLTALLYEDMRWRWLWRAAAVLIALRVMPPESDLRPLSELPDKDNAFQMAQLTLLGLVLIFVTLPLPLRKRFLRYLSPIEAGVCLLALVLPLIGLERALRLWNELQLEVSLGGGAVLYTAVVLGIILLALRRLKTNDPVLSEAVS
ncbi:MAG: hypothetical protein K8I82_18150 [Anaerolineae bacterium]|nr:hypothetical protein [Anaerolineae bacterium]